ncbi:unnamed protein product [Caenorhabditis angaria]|uniref:Uncharacterized protein n=1 Tax=Caenorhabditis angaria TaxID=860376 RepID=A0A9P1IM39_9PELO|nr:unnamed protein product [Caenorhabditis angaria]
MTSSDPTETETTPWTTSGETCDETSSIGSSDTNYNIQSLNTCNSSAKGSTTSVLCGRDLTEEEIKWLEMAKEYTKNEKPFKNSSVGRKVVRKFQAILPAKSKLSFTVLRRKFNGRQDVKDLRDEDQTTSDV